MKRLTRSFFSRYTPDVAKELLGCLLVRKQGTDDTLSGIIVEVEAYRGSDDPASHSYRGMTKRNALMFGEAGHAYIYFSYGNHWCLNFTTEGKGEPGAVLVRALEPVDGIPQMRRNRGRADARDLASGPGKLTQALGLDRSLNGEDIIRSRRLYVVQGGTPRSISSSARIGVSRGLEQRWRFYVDGNPYVSKGSKGIAGRHPA